MAHAGLGGLALAVRFHSWSPKRYPFNDITVLTSDDFTLLLTSLFRTHGLEDRYQAFLFPGLIVFPS